MTHKLRSLDSRWLAVALLAATPACNTPEPTSVTQCKQYRSAYCDYVARCTGGPVTSALKDQCQQVFAQSGDCGQATQVIAGTDSCVSALATVACTGGVPTACSGQMMTVPPPVTCKLDPTASAADQSKMLDECMATQLSTVVLDSRARTNLDVLFLVDNSPSMSPKQSALAKSIPGFMKLLDATGTNYHIGITTADVGTQRSPGVPWGGNLGKCETYEGDDGVLQNVACSTRNDTTADAKNACATLCPDSKFVPNDGRRYISKTDGVTNVPVARALDPMTGKMVDTGPTKAFQCMALVGDSGCGIESPLEGAKRALDGHRVENSGFLRSDSTLAVVFITDEDDCSVQLAQRAQLDPMTRDCDPAQPDSADCYNIDFRCFARSVQCNESMLTTGVKTGCVERPSNFLTSVDTYAKFFNTLRPKEKLLVSGIWTLPSVLSGGRVELAKSGGTTSAYLNRAGGAGASCRYAGNSAIFGQAQLRLSKFASQIPGSTETSICDIDNYPAALSQVASRVATKLTASCLTTPPSRSSMGKPLCVVGDVDEQTPTAPPTTLFGTCSSDCCNAFATSSQPTPQDPAIAAACAAETAEACYCAQPSQAANVCTGGAVVGVWRKGGTPPPVAKVTSFRCLNP